MWYINRSGKTAGPFKSEDLKQMADAGLIQPTDQVRQEGTEKWVEARKVKGLFSAPEDRKREASPTPEKNVPVKATLAPDDEAKLSGRRKKDEEEVLFDEGGVVVTTTRFVVHNRTFAMSGITACTFSVRPGVWKVHRGMFFFFAFILIFLTGAVSSIFDTPGFLVSAVLLTVALAGVAFGKFCRYPTAARYCVTVGTAGREVQALWDYNEHFIRRIVKAVTDAMIARG